MYGGLYDTTSLAFGVFRDAATVNNCYIEDEPLSYSAFIRYLDKAHPTLRFAKPGSDFCDLYTTLSNDLNKLLVRDPRHSYLSALLEHRWSDTGN